MGELAGRFGNPPRRSVAFIWPAPSKQPTPKAIVASKVPATPTPTQQKVATRQEPQSPAASPSTGFSCSVTTSLICDSKSVRGRFTGRDSLPAARSSAGASATETATGSSSVTKPSAAKTSGENGHSAQVPKPGCSKCSKVVHATDGHCDLAWADDVPQSGPAIDAACDHRVGPVRGKQPFVRGTARTHESGGFRSHSKLQPRTRQRLRSRPAPTTG